MLVALAQMDIAWENYNENINKVKAFAKEASIKKAEFILFPEMCLSGFTNNINGLEKSEDEIIETLKTIAKDNKINIGLGFAVKEGLKGANKYVIVSENGELLGNYTKIHPFTFSGEDKVYHKGEQIETCNIGKFKVTPFICYDLRFPEIFQIASKQAHIITVAASWPKSRREHWLALLKARAIENQCYVLGINRVGIGDEIEYGGESIFVSPSGEFLNDLTSEEKNIIQNLELNKISDEKNQFDIKKDRRENLYSKLILFKSCNNYNIL